MNSKIKTFLLCPIPDNQKPINEYIELKENFSSNWTTYSNKYYFNTLTFLFSFFFLTIAFFQIFTNNNNINKLTVFIFSNFLISTILETLILLSIILLLNFLIWSQIQYKFFKSFVFYEESSWFDSQIWQKPYFLIKNDQLINKQKIFFVYL